MEVVDIITLVVANIKSTYAETRDKAEWLREAFIKKNHFLIDIRQ